MLPCILVARIQILPRKEADRIAAGEVVERPASVVRELVENALDAEAGRVDVEVAGGGLERIRVADDGVGMGREDARRALERHATSKIRSVEDLSGVRTLGFRGEALPSIGAVSRLELLTSESQGGEATRIQMEGGTVLREEPATRPRGTTVTVADLFFNTPARRKFLKSPGAEFTRISETLLPEALVRPSVSFSLTHDGREVLALPAAADPAERIAAVWGPRFADDLVPFRRETPAGTVAGYLSGPDETRASRRQWYLFVNGRPVRDRVMVHAASQGVEGALSKGRYPVLFLYLTLPDGQVDVNVHPAKAEVRFAETGRVYALVTAALREALQPVPYLPGGPRPDQPAAPPGSAGPAGSRVAATGASYETVAGASHEPPTGRLFQPVSLAGDSPRDEEEASVAALREAAPVVLAQYRSCFIVAHDAGSLYLIDQHTAHERVLYEEIRADLERGAGEERQALLLPRTLELERGTGDAVTAALPQIERFGFRLERFGEDALILREVPAYLPPGAAEDTLRDLVGIVTGASGPDAARQEAGRRLEHRLAATVACHAAVKIHFTLTTEKMENIVGRLFSCREPLTCPHGRTVVVRWDHGQILRAFSRPDPTWTA
jgi:DNA mismatch repair protein MutL